MKAPSSKSLKLILSAGVAILVQSTVASGAAIVTNTSFISGDTATFTPPSSLLIGATVIGISGTNGTPVASGGGGFAGWGEMNDGIVGTAKNNNSQALLLESVVNPWVAWKLDTSVNTLGYDITSIESFAGFNSDRGWQAVQIKYALVGETVSLNTELTHTLAGGPFTYQPVNPGIAPDDYGASMMTIEDTVFGNAFLTGISAIQVSYVNNGFGPNQTSYREFSVVGAATVPEPSSLLLSGAALLGFLLPRQRARR